MMEDPKGKTVSSGTGTPMSDIGTDVGHRYLPTIGLEIHAELATASKMFCSCKNDPDEKRPNANVCPICLGHPGTLPVLNHEAIKNVLRVGVAVNGTQADFTEWDRKQYFYPDIPKGYQISQYAYPLVSGGELAGVALERIHLEEDTAQSTHDTHEKSLVNFNRAGVPLMELVTKPVIHDAATAVRFAKELQLLLRYLGAGEANMEKGELRVEANISVAKIAPEEAKGVSRNCECRSSSAFPQRTSPLGHVRTCPLGNAATNDFTAESQFRETPFASSGAADAREKILGTKTEVKNLNSFRAVEKAIEYEVARQIELLERGEEVVQETRGWDDKKGVTFSQRSKESAHDYRYFPDPDIPKMKLSEIAEFSREELSKSLPELPWQKRERFKRDYGATDKEAEVFVEDSELANYFEEIIEAGDELRKSRPESSGDELKTDKKKYSRLAMNYLLTDYLGAMKTLKSDTSKYSIPSTHWAELMGMIVAGELSSRGAKDILAEMIKEPPKHPRKIAVERGLLQKNDPKALREVVQRVLETNKGVVDEYKAGKTASLQYLIGQTMKETKGSANPATIKEILLGLLGQN